MCWGWGLTVEMANKPSNSKTFRQSGNIKIVAGVFILLLTPVLIVFGRAQLRGELDDPALFGVMMLFFLPFYVGSWWLLWQFNGRFHLTPHAIILKQLGRTTEIAYADIIQLEERNQPAPHLRLRTHQNQKLIILYQTERFSELYAALRQHVSLMQQAEAVSFPLELRLPANYYRQGILPAMAILLFFGVLTVRLVSERPHLTAWHGAGFMGFICLLILFVVFVTDHGSPTAVTFSDFDIQTSSLFGREKAWPANDIANIARERQKRHYKGATYIVQPLVITFSDGKRLLLDEGRIWAFGYAPDRLHTILARHYRGTQATANELITRANKAYEAKDYETAVSLYNEAITLYSPYTSYKLIVADTLYHLRRPPEALVAYQELIEFVPEHDQGWVGIGRCQMLLNELPAAADAFSRALHINPDEATAHYNLAMVQAKQNQRAAARASLHRALELQPKWREHVEQDVFLQQLL